MLLFRCQAAAAVATLLIASAAAFDEADFGLDMCEDYEDELENCADDTCNCPEGFHVCAGRCYMAGSDKLPYTAAEAYCESVGAHLAAPRDPDVEIPCLSGLLPEGSYGWLGYSGGTSDSDPHRRADDGSPISDLIKEDFDGNEPSYISQCVSFFPRFWLDDKECGTNFYPMCQLRDCYRPQCPEATQQE